MAGDDEALSKRLQEAIVMRDEDSAVAAASGISAWAPLARAILLACARIDGSLTFGHDVKVVTAAIRLGGVLPEVAGFLARLPAGDRMSRAILPPIRAA
jgi:hypothetical protein